MVLTSAVYIGATVVWRAPVRFCRFDLPLPSTRFALTQLVTSMVDWTLAAAVVYVLLPSSPLTFPVVLGAFLVALVVGLVSHQHGGSLYNFQGLRAYKQKFNPEWQPRYLVYPGGMRLARILADVSALIAGGYRHIFHK